jgi:hypothetical protein
MSHVRVPCLWPHVTYTYGHGTRTWDTDMGHGHGTQTWDTDMVHRHGTQTWNMGHGTWDRDKIQRSLDLLVRWVDDREWFSMWINVKLYM